MEEHRRTKVGQGLPHILKVFLAILAAMLLVDVACVELAKMYMHLGAPYSVYLLPAPRCDYYAFLAIYPRLHHFSFFDSGILPMFRYPAPVILLYAMFYPFRQGVDYFMLVTLAIYLAGGALVAAAMVRRGVSVLTAGFYIATCELLAYPLYFEFRQGNTEPFIFLLIALAVWSMLRGKNDAAGVLLGVAGAMKIYPFIFLGILLQRRQYRSIVLAVGTAVLLTLASLRFLTPSIVYSWHGIGRGLANYDDEFNHLIPIVFGYDHSLFAPVKLVTKLWPGGRAHIHAVLNIYLAVAATGGTALWFLRIRKLPMINQVCCLVVAEVFLPPSSYDYTLTHLFIPWAMLALLALEARGRRVAGLNAAFCCLALLCGFETEFIANGLRFAGCVKAVEAAVLFIVMLRFPLPSRFADGELASAVPLSRPLPRLEKASVGP